MAIDSETVAMILVLSGMNWSNADIATEVGVSESTVSKYLNLIEEESKADGTDPESVFLSYYVEGLGERLGAAALVQ